MIYSFHDVDNIIHLTLEERVDITLQLALILGKIRQRKKLILLLEFNDIYQDEEEIIVKEITDNFRTIFIAIGFKFRSSSIVYTFGRHSYSEIKKVLSKYKGFEKLD